MNRRLTIIKEEITDDSFGLLISPEELVTNSELPDHIGLHLPRIKRRIQKIRGEQFVPSVHFG